MLARAVSCALVFAAVIVSMPRPAAAGAWMLARGEHATSLSGDFLHAKTYRDAEGTRIPLADGMTLEERTVAYRTQVGWLSGTNVFFDLPWRSVSSVLPDTSESRTGFGDLVLGVQQALIGGAAGGTVVSIEARLEAPLGYEVRGTRAPIGFDQTAAAGAVHLGLSLPALRGYVQASGGYRYQFDRFADQLLGSADLVIGATSAIQVGGRWRAALASGDAEAGGVEATEHLVGPLLVYRVDERLDLFGGSWHTPAGENVLHKNQLYLGMSFKQTRLDRSQGFLGGSRP